MKKSTIIIIISFIVAILAVVGILSDEGFENSGVKTTSYSYSSSYNNGKLTKSEREDLAKKAILKGCLEKMEYEFRNYDLDATKYKLGNVTHSGNKITMYITFYLYDNYGTLKETVQNESSVTVDEYGDVGYPSIGSFKYK